MSFFNHGYLYNILEEYDKSLADFSRVIELDPAGLIPYLQRGNVYLSLGENELALADFDQAIALDPSLANAYLGRGHAYTVLGEDSLAIADFNQVLEISDDPRLRGDALSRLNYIRDNPSNECVSRLSVVALSHLMKSISW